MVSFDFPWFLHYQKQQIIVFQHSFSGPPSSFRTHSYHNFFFSLKSPSLFSYILYWSHSTPLIVAVILPYTIFSFTVLFLTCQSTARSLSSGRAFCKGHCRKLLFLIVFNNLFLANSVFLLIALCPNNLWLRWKVHDLGETPKGLHLIHPPGRAMTLIPYLLLLTSKMQLTYSPHGSKLHLMSF